MSSTKPEGVSERTLHVLRSSCGEEGAQVAELLEGEGEAPAQVSELTRHVLRASCGEEGAQVAAWLEAPSETAQAGAEEALPPTGEPRQTLGQG